MRITGSPIPSASSDGLLWFRLCAGWGGRVADGDAELNIVDDSLVHGLAQFRQDLKAQVEKLFLPNGVVDLDYQAPTNHGFRRGVNGDAASHRDRPRGASKLFREIESSSFNFARDFAARSMRTEVNFSIQRNGLRLEDLLSPPIRKCRDVFRLVGRTPLSARDAFVPPQVGQGADCGPGGPPYQRRFKR